MYERIARLVERLHERTSTRSIAWKESPTENFQTSFPHYTVELSKSNREEVFLTIYNEEGQIVENVSDETLRAQQGVDNQGAMLYELYEMARRTALGSDEAIEELISALED